MLSAAISSRDISLRELARVPISLALGSTQRGYTETPRAQSQRTTTGNFHAGELGRPRAVRLLHRRRRRGKKKTRSTA